MALIFKCNESLLVNCSFALARLKELIDLTKEIGLTRPEDIQTFVKEQQQQEQRQWRWSQPGPSRCLLPESGSWDISTPRSAIRPPSKFDATTRSKALEVFVVKFEL